MHFGKDGLETGRHAKKLKPRSKYRSGASAGRLGDDLSRSCWQKLALSRSDSLIPEGTSRRRAETVNLSPLRRSLSEHLNEIAMSYDV